MPDKKKPDLSDILLNDNPGIIELGNELGEDLDYAFKRDVIYNIEKAELKSKSTLVSKGHFHHHWCHRCQAVYTTKYKKGKICPTCDHRGQHWNLKRTQNGQNAENLTE
jgi:predicted NodU family carbamoyl transferase